MAKHTPRTLPAGSGVTEPLAEDSTPSPAAQPALSRWLVEVYGVPSREVEAESEDAARLAFFSLFNIIRTKHPVIVTRLG